MLAPQTAITRAKSPEAFRTISEVSADLDVPQHVLRFWEQRFAQVRPIKRAGGRRYYRPEDVDLLRGIRALLYSDGFTIRGVQKILRDRGLRHVAQLGRTFRGDLDDTTRDTEFEPSRDEPLDLASEAETGKDRNNVRAMIAALAREHSSPACNLAEEERVRLELLLAELLQLKSRLRVAQSKGA